MPQPITRIFAAGTAGLCLALAAGCGGDSSGPADQPLTPSEAQMIGADVAGALEGISSEFTIGGLVTPSFPFLAAEALAGRPFGLPPRPSRLNCPILTPFPPVDTDGDKVPDDLTLSFTLPDCSFAIGRTVFEITGTVHITDPTTMGPGQRVVFTDFQHKVTTPNGRFFLRRLNGVRQHLVTDILSFTDSTTSVLESSERPTATLANAWQVTFTPSPGEVFDNDRHLPSGDFTISGNTTHTFGRQLRSLTVMTVTPVHLDAACTSRPPLTSGEVLITVVHGDRTTTIHIVFNGCGVEPTVTFEETAAA